MALFGMGLAQRLTNLLWRAPSKTDMRAISVFVLAAGFTCAARGQEFEVVSTKPNPSGNTGQKSSTDRGTFMATNNSLRRLIVRAYGVKDYQVEGPDWLDSARFDIAAKIPEATSKDKQAEAFSAMMQKMLADRFKLAVHRDQKTLPIYGLVVEKKGTKFKEVSGCSPADRSDNRHLEATCITMDRFAAYLSQVSDRPVLDMTGLKGYYSFKLDWFPEPDRPGDAPAGPALPEALKEQLGLSLETRKAPVEVLVVDHAERTPTEN